MSPPKDDDAMPTRRRKPVMDPATLFRRIPLAPHELTAPVTAADDVFVLAHLGIPRIGAEDWVLEVGGLVERPLRLSLAALAQWPRHTVQAFHECAGFPRAPDRPTRRVANVVWGGIDLSAVLDAAGVRTEARFLWSYGVDHGEYDGVEADCYVKDLPLARLADGGVLLADTLNGAPLSPEHGFPLRLVVPGFYGTNSVKWLYRLELADRRADSPFTTTFYNDPLPDSAGNSAGGTKPVWAVAPESVIVVPAPDARLAGDAVEVRGWAWAAAGVETVEFSGDGGETWDRCEVGHRTEWSWQRFRYVWRPKTHGPATLAARATDRNGATQPMRGARNAVHTVAVEIEGIGPR